MMNNMSNRKRKREGKKNATKKKTGLKSLKKKVGNDGRGVLKKSKAIDVIRSGRFSGRALSIRKGSGGPGGNKHRKAFWYEGGPMKHIGGEKYESTVYSTMRKDL